MYLYFVAGIYGVGKTSLCKELASALHASHFTASTLIRHGATIEGPSKKAVRNVNANQKRLVLALEDLRQSTARMLLDGHFCVFGTDNAIVPIPLEVFAALRPAAILLVEAPTDVVRTRLEQRDGVTYEIGLLNELARQEREQAEFVSSCLQVPLYSVGADASLEEAIAFLESSSDPRC